MASWSDLVAAEPDFARVVRARLDAGKHKTLATLRADGSPRISGIETFVAEGELWFGSMPGARKARDLRRDPRFALHGASVDPPEWTGDAKLSGRADEITDPERHARIFAAHGADESFADSHLFRADLVEVVLVGLNDTRDQLVIEHWHELRGLRRIERG